MDMTTEKATLDVAPRNINLDLLKIMACLAVVCMHTIQSTISYFNLVICYMCTFAIPVFFASSGFALLHREGISYKYSLKKSLHILRITFIWSLPLGLLKFVAERISKTDLFDTPFIKEVTYFPLIQQGSMGHLWFLGAMMILYFLLPVLQRLVKRSRKRWALAWTAFAVICGAVQAASLFIGRPVQKDVIQTFRLWTWIQYFLLGGGITYFISALSDRISVKLHGFITAIWTILVVTFQAFCGSAVIHDTHLEYYYDDILIIIWVLLLISFVLRIELSKPVKKAVEFLTPLIMGVYIIHPLINKVCLHFLIIDNVIGAVVYSLSITVVSFTGSYIIYKLPFGKYLIKI